MHYEFNISQHGKHVFATHERSGRVVRAEAAKLLRLFEEKFPESDGWKVDVVFYPGYGEHVDFSKDPLSSADGRVHG